LIPAAQQKAAENVQAGQLVGQVAFTVAGDIAEKNGWKESSPQKIALHAVAGYVMSVAGGGNGATGALAAATNEATTKKVNEIVDEAIPLPVTNDPLNPTAAEKTALQDAQANRKSVKEAASTLVGITAVATTGGTNQQMATGGTVALTADQFNRQSHPSESQLIRDNAASFARQRFGVDSPSAAQVDQAERELTQQALKQVDSDFAGYANDKEAAAYLNMLTRGQGSNESKFLYDRIGAPGVRPGTTAYTYALIDAAKDIGNLRNEGTGVKQAVFTELKDA
jgi:filamentous hemagglutinin